MSDDPVIRHSVGQGVIQVFPMMAWSRQRVNGDLYEAEEIEVVSLCEGTPHQGGPMPVAMWLLICFQPGRFAPLEVAWYMSLCEECQEKAMTVFGEFFEIKGADDRTG